MKEKIDEILAKMSLQEKIELCSGKSFWETKDYEKYGVPSLFMCDGPHGLRKQEGAGDMLGVNRSQPATCFPTAVTTGSSWDVSLLEEIGSAIGEEAAAAGVGLVLGPGANIKRSPLCGRNFEYISEDPFVTGKLAGAMIKGIQRNGTAASLKHFAANSQEFSRFSSDSVMDQRTLREIYLTGFEMAVKEGKPATVMCAYNKLNGVHCSDSRVLLSDILREDWGFEGMVVTDWGAMNDRIEGFRAGCDLNMPGGSQYMEKDCVHAVEAGTLSESDVDACARRVLELVLRSAENLKKKTAFEKEEHHVLARKAAEQGAVLLQNDEGILPLSEDAGIAVIGSMARTPRYQGAGSSHINPYKVSAALDFLPGAVYAPGCDEQGDTTDNLLAEAAAAAKQAEVAVVFAGLPDRYESEGFDRDDMKLPEGHTRMIETVAAVNPNTVVVLSCGSPVECSWADRVKGILFLGLPGQAGGEAVANLLYGRANPGGKLAETWPVSYEDCPASGHYSTKDALYLESIYVGYRYYDKAGVPVRWRFGHGLSYTTFAYSNLQIIGDTITVTVENTGDRAGAEVVQLYIAPPQGSGQLCGNAAAFADRSHIVPLQEGLHRPLRELKGFEKVFLQPGERRTVSFLLMERSFAVWADGWKVPGGIYTVQAGGLELKIKKDGDMIQAPSWQAGTWYETMQGMPVQREWEAMLGHTYVEQKPVKGSFTMDNSVVEMKDYSIVMKIMHSVVERIIAKDFGGKKDYSNPQFRMLMASSVGSPLRAMMISGGIKGGIFPGLLEMANGHYLKGIWKMIRG